LLSTLPLGSCGILERLKGKKLELNLVSPYPSLVALLIALGTCIVLMKLSDTPPTTGRFATLDGLRGYLAFFVYLHHAAIWYFYLRTGEWRVPPSNLYTHFGQSSVAMFFMITGFLFWSKLIDGRLKPIDWLKLYVSRIMRIVPLYIFALTVLAVIVVNLSGFVMNDPPFKLLKNIIRWASFTLLGSPDLNGVMSTSLIIARVTWSLPYEWLFYFSLPIFALLLRSNPPIPYIACGFAAVAVFFLLQFDKIHLVSFGGGIAAAYIVRLDTFRFYANHIISTVLAIISIVASILIFPSAYNLQALSLLTIAFITIACGNNLFGLLTNPVSRKLGEMGYSIYLLHGMLLFTTFKFIVGFKRAASLTVVEHWSIILCCVPILILCCSATFHYIEAPCMKAVPYTSARMRQLLLRIQYNWRNFGINVSERVRFNSDESSNSD